MKQVWSQLACASGLVRPSSAQAGSHLVAKVGSGLFSRPTIEKKKKIFLGPSGVSKTFLLLGGMIQGKNQRDSRLSYEKTSLLSGGGAIIVPRMVRVRQNGGSYLMN